MPYVSRLFIKTGIVYLVLTFAAGAAILGLTSAGVSVPFIIEVEHGHLGFVGWLVNVVVGVALWMFPLDRERYPDMQGRYPAKAPLWCYFLLNIGLALRIVLEPLVQLEKVARVWAYVLAASGVLQLAAIVIFVGIVWYRTKGPSRPAPGI